MTCMLHVGSAAHRSPPMALTATLLCVFVSTQCNGFAGADSFNKAAETITASTARICCQEMASCSMTQVPLVTGRQTVAQMECLQGWSSPDNHANYSYSSMRPLLSVVADLRQSIMNVAVAQCNLLMWLYFDYLVC